MDSSLIWILVPLAAIIGGLYIEYQKNKMKMMEQGQQNEQEVDDLHKLVNMLKGRIENLEAIAAGEPDEFKTGAGKGIEEIEIDEPEASNENKKEVSKIANQLRSE